MTLLVLAAFYAYVVGTLAMAAAPVGGAHRVCFECDHAYRTARALRRDYRRSHWEATGMQGWHPAMPLWRRIWGAVTVRASRVPFCPRCLHDW